MDVKEKYEDKELEALVKEANDAEARKCSVVGRFKGDMASICDWLQISSNFLQQLKNDIAG